MKKILEEILRKPVLEGKDLSPYLTLRVGGKAPYFFVVESFADWLRVKELLKEGIIDIFVLGGGSNLVVKNLPRNTLVILNRYAKMELLGEDKDKVFVKVSSGYAMTRFVKECVFKGWEGLEYHWGLPGTVGGAVYMNSKWTRPETYVGDVLYKALLLTRDGEFKEVKREYFKFDYDYSILHETGEIVIEVVFKFTKADPEILYKRSMEAYKYRRETQPVGVFTSGCFFQNISEAVQKKLNLPTKSAGYLIDKAGLKGFRIGGFQISEKHANFIINVGEGRIEDLEKLVEAVKKRVKEKFNVDLELEVIIV